MCLQLIAMALHEKTFNTIDQVDVIITGKSLMAKWLEQASQWHDMYYHDLDVMSSNPSGVELGVQSTSVPNHTWTKNVCYVIESSIFITVLSLVILILIDMLVLMVLMLTVSKSLKNLFWGKTIGADLPKQCKMKTNAKLAALFII